MLACYPHLSQMLLFKEVSSLFWPHQCKRGIHSFCLKLKSIVLMPSVFPSSFIFCTILLCSLSILGFFFSFIAFLWLEQLPCLLTRILLTMTTHWFCKLSLLITPFFFTFLLNGWEAVCSCDFLRSGHYHICLDFSLTLFRVNEKNTCMGVHLSTLRQGLWVLSWSGKLIIHSVKLLVQSFLGPDGYVLC